MGALKLRLDILEKHGIVKTVVASEAGIGLPVMVVTFDKVFHIIAFGEICSNATRRVGGGTLAVFAHPHVDTVTDVNRRSSEITTGNIERILRLYVAILA